MPDWLITLLITLLKGVLVALALLTTFAYMTLIERRLLARMQIRYGPNRVGPGGLLQPLADAVKSRMFMFEDIVTLEDRSIQLVLREVDTAELALALKGVAEVVREKITKNLSERAATNLIEEVELLGQVRLSQVEEAQQNIIRTIRSLEEQGQIMVRRGNDDEFVS